MSELLPCLTCKTPTPSGKLSAGGNCKPCEKVLARQRDMANKGAAEESPELKAVEESIDTGEFRELDKQRLESEQSARASLVEDAKREEAARELARRRLLPFVMRFNPEYDPGWLHADICRRLERFSQDVRDKKSPRLMLFVPPRHGKSEIASRNFPAFHLGHCPTHEIIQSSYSADLALDFSRKVRDIIRSKSYQNLFETRLDSKTQAVERWATSAGGAYAAVGVRGPITGRGAHIGIIDDPVKDRQDAESAVLRQQIKDWYSSTFYTRLAPGGGVLVIMTRWHEDDLAGWLVSLMAEAEKEAAASGHWPEDADKWEIIRYPAIAEEDEQFRKMGEALHPNRYPLRALNKIKRTLINRDWIALYQQRPVAEDGDFFKREHFKFYSKSELPPLDELSIYAAWDHALGKKDVHDYTVCIVVGIDKRGNIWVLHVMRAKLTSLEIIDRMFDVQDTHQPVLQGMEESLIELAIEPVLLKTMDERRQFIPYEKLKVRGMDKVARAQPIRARVEQGKVYLPMESDAAWVGPFIEELLKFPSGTNDDQVDAFAWIGQMLLMYASVYSRVEDKTPKWMRKLKMSSKTRSRSAMSA